MENLEQGAEDDHGGAYAVGEVEKALASLPLEELLYLVAVYL